MNIEKEDVLNGLKKIINDSNTDLKIAVAESILDAVTDYDDPVDYFNDLLTHGCISGMVGELVYYADTHAFYDKHYEDIEDLRYEMAQELGELNPPKDQDLKNWFAWFAYEETARQIALELGIDL